MSERETCWWNKYVPEKGACTAPGIYGNTDLPLGGAQTRWCEEHKHIGDIRVAEPMKGKKP